MEWYQLLADFFAGVFLTNAVPHFIHGISGDRFPTVFSKPRGVGLSSPTVNVLWALVCIVAGYLFLREGNPGSDHIGSMAALFAGVAAISIMLSIRFQSKHKE
jgi:hypothetical protein